MSRWLPISSAPRDGTSVDVFTHFGRVIDSWWIEEKKCWAKTITYPTHWMPSPGDPSDTDDLDAQLSPESLADVQAGRQVCRAIYTGLAEVASLESLKKE